MNVAMQLTLAILFLGAGDFARAQSVYGTLRVVKGDVQIKSAKSGTQVRARIGEQVFPKDVVVTGKDARAKIVMVDNNEINVSPDSQIEIQHYEYDPAAGKKDVLLNVIYGKVRSKVEQKYDGKTSKFQIKTPAAVAGVRGTDFLTSYDRASGQSSITTFEGKVEFGKPGPGGTIVNPVFVTPGQQSTSMAGAPPAAPAPLPKEELAKMDRETKADTAPVKGEQPRQPATEPEKKKDDGAKNGPRQPASVAGPSSGGCEMCGKETGPPPPPPIALPSLPAVPVPVALPPGLNDCTYCNTQIQTGRSKVLINVKTN